METIYFVLGMLSIVGAIFIATIVWGVVKINKLIKIIRNQEDWIVNNDRYVHESFTDLRKDMSRDFDDTHRRIVSVSEELNRNIDERATNTISYVDSRIDKALGSAGAKQVIKG